MKALLYGGGSNRLMAYKPYKKDFDYSYTLGVFPTVELLQRRSPAVNIVYIHSSALDNQGVRKIVSMCEQAGIPCEIQDKMVQKLSTKDNCYAVGIFSKYEETLDCGAPHLVLANPSDMGNLGTIIRTMLGFGIRDLGIIRPAADVFDPKVVRGSMGALFSVRIQHFDTFDAYRKTYDRDIYTFMLDGEVTLDEISIRRHPYTLVFGNESAGLSDEYKQVGTSIVIPHSNLIDSLNLSVAVGIALYRLSRDRRP